MPGSSLSLPSSPQDFAIGAKVEVFKHKFIITDADEYVLKYMEARVDAFPAETIESLRKKHRKGPADGDSKA